MRLTKKNISLIIFVISLLIYYLPQAFNSNSPSQNVAGTTISVVPTTPINLPSLPITGIDAQTEIARVNSIVDGDTIKLDNGKTLRYIGIDTPESVDPRRPHQCFGKEASEFNKSLVLNHTVRLEKDVSETDRYGRLLRYVYLENGQMINEILVKEGYAFARSYPPDIKYQNRFTEAEKNARNQQKGFWTGCTIENGHVKN